MVKWSHTTLTNKSYIKRRVDGTVYDKDEGFKSTFEAVIDKEGYEEEGYNFDDENKQKALLKIIKEYSSLLTSNQKLIFSYLQKGLTHEQVAKELGITHQAVSFSFVEIRNKIRSQFGNFSLKDDSYNKVSEGKAAIEQFFKPSGDLITEKDREKLKVIVHLHPAEFTSKEISKMFFDKRYSFRQIVSCCVKMGWSSFLKKERSSCHFTSKTETLILNMYKKGLNSEEISDLLNIPIKSLRSKRGHLVCLGLLEPNYPRIRQLHDEKI